MAVYRLVPAGKKKGGICLKYLVKRAQKRDDQAFVELMEIEKQDMYKVARSYLRSPEDIADAIQETITTCYEKIDGLKEPKYFKTWLIRAEGFKIREIAQILELGF